MTATGDKNHEVSNEPGSKLLVLGMVIQPLIGILIMGPYKPLCDWVEFPIPYYMEIMRVDRPWHKCILPKEPQLQVNEVS